MGKQINFYHTDEDFLVLQVFFAEHGLEMFKINRAGEKIKAEGIFTIFREPGDCVCLENKIMSDLGCYIEFDLSGIDTSNRSIPENRIGITCGRFYLRNECYHKESIKVFDLLKRYIKKNFICNDRGRYYSPTFAEMMQTEKYVVMPY